jgi:hypothetical protein
LTSKKELIEVSDSDSSSSLEEETNSEDSQSFCGSEELSRADEEGEQEDGVQSVFKTAPTKMFSGAMIQSCTPAVSHLQL